MDSDLELLERWRGGDPGAGQELIKRHFHSIHRFFDRKCRGDADDLVQRTMFQCVRSRDRFRAASSFRTFLFAIARHELYQHLREGRHGEPVDLDHISIADLVTTAGTKLDRARRAQRLQLALSTLSVEQQVLLEMHYWHELDSTELSEIFEIPAATVRTKLHRARQALRAKLGDAEVETKGDRLAESLTELGDDTAT